VSFEDRQLQPNIQVREEGDGVWSEYQKILLQHKQKWASTQFLVTVLVTLTLTVMSFAPAQVDKLTGNANCTLYVYNNICNCSGDAKEIESFSVSTSRLHRDIQYWLQVGIVYSGGNCGDSCTISLNTASSGYGNCSPAKQMASIDFSVDNW